MTIHSIIKGALLHFCTNAIVISVFHWSEKQVVPPPNSRYWWSFTFQAGQSSFSYKVGERASILTFRKLYSNFNFCFYLVECFFPTLSSFFASIRAVISAVNTRPPRALCVRVCVRACVCVCVAVRVLRSVAAWGHCITASPTQVST